MKSFQEFSLAPQLLRNVSRLGWKTPTEVQRQSIPLVLTSRDVLVQSATGTGKSGAFLIPLVQKIQQQELRSTCAIILSPTRDLAEQTYQVAEQLAEGLCSVALITPAGSVRVQEILLQQNPQILIATPGRLLDHIKNNSSFTIFPVQYLVLDECDKMLELGFLLELKEIISAIEQKRETLLFSATAVAVKEIAGFALQKEIMVKVDPDKSVATNIQQEFIIINNFMGLLQDEIRKGKLGEKYIIKCVICKYLLELKEFSGKKVIIFCNYKNQVRLVNYFLAALGIASLQITGDCSSAERELIIEQFRQSAQPLVTTDLLARGMDFENVDLVIEYELSTPDSYIHRSGRTGRAGKEGTVISLAFSAEIKDLTANLAKMRFKERVIDKSKMASLLADVSCEMTEQITNQIKEDEIEKKDQMLQLQEQKIDNMEKYADEIATQERRRWVLDTREKRILKNLQEQFKQGNIDEEEAKSVIINKGLRDEERKLQLIKSNQRAKSNVMSQDLQKRIRDNKRKQKEQIRNDGIAMRKQRAKRGK